MVIGRAEEQARIRALLTGARSGRSGALVLSGEPGVGKSVLLDFAAEQGAGMRVLRATGVETEVDLAFAGLHQLLRPVLPLVDRLPARQAEALLAALGLVPHGGHDRFLVAVATLSLLSEAAEDGPVLCLVEDAHWLDVPSAEAVAFAMRRLDAEGVVVLVATRDDAPPGLPSVVLDGLDPADVRGLLRERIGEVAAEVSERVAEETGGNALAVVELAESLTPAQLSGDEPLPPALPLSSRVQQAFLARVRLLPPASQTLLLVAAADDTGDPAVVLAAAADFGTAADALEAAERAGLVRIDSAGQLAFRHPLVRAAVYQGATFVARVAAHRALAGALEGEDQVERRAWHLAAAAIGPDETVARELERSASAAQERGGYAVAAAAFERAAQLSPPGPHRRRRTVAAAQAAYQAGQADRAAELVDEAGRLVDDGADGDEIVHLRGRIEFARGSSTQAHTLLMAAARRVSSRDPRRAATMLIEAARAAWNASDADRLIETTRVLAGLRLPPGDGLGPLVSTTIGAGDLVAERIPEGIARIRGGTEALLGLLSADQPGGMDSAAVEAAVAMAGATRVVGDDTAGLTLGSWTVTQCRTQGLAALLPWALVNQSMTEALAGRHSAGLLNAMEALKLARDLGQHTVVCSCESILAWLAAVRGEQDQCRALADHSVELADSYGLAAIAVMATWALGVLELSLGRPERALDRLLDRTRGPLVVATTRCLIVPDIVEAATRVGRTGDLDEFMTWYETWATHTGQPWALATLHRCRAMLTGDEAEPHFAAALREHGRGGPHDRVFDRARTQLLYGEWLRRARRRADARAQLAAAHEIFDRLGATPWTERAGTELRATGQTVQRRDPARPRLTAQETQVVRLVAEGASNQEVAAQLFLSPRTVAYHLYKAFPKLGVVSRAELARVDLDALIVP
jgi:DNA-binding CsgD family transcriptional regulator